MFGFVFGFLYGSLLEYLIHDLVFHRMGKKKGSIWSYHLRGHHALAKKNKFLDQTKSKVETYGLLILIAIHLPLLLVSVGFTIGVVTYAVAFNLLHGFQHRHPEFTKKYMKWHWDHHMGPRECVEANWCVTFPLFDYVMGTRKPYYNTNRYFMDMAKKSVRAINEKDN